MLRISLPVFIVCDACQNSLKKSGHSGFEFLEFWCWNTVPFLPDIGEFVVVVFHFNDMPNILDRWNIWSAGRPSQHQALLQWSHGVIIAGICCVALSCWNTHGLPWSRRCLEGTICCSKTFIYFSIYSSFQNVKTTDTVCTYAPRYLHRYWFLNWMLMTCWKVCRLFCPEDVPSVITNKNVKLRLVWP